MKRGGLGKQTIANISRKKAGLVLLADNFGKGMERQAKFGAPWTDRTAMARKAIHGGGERKSTGAVTYLAHGMEYGAYLEEGTGIYGPRGTPITIKAKNKKALFWNGAKHPVKQVTHPGMRSKPIIKPTADKYWPKIKKGIREYWGS